MSRVSAAAHGPRAVNEADFPAQAPLEEQARFLLNYAVLAPSVLNTQPWRFEVEGALVRLYADRSRQLLALDPAGRELTISCGAALFHFIAAARRFGIEAQAHPFPVASTSDLLATVTMNRAHRLTEADERLFEAIRQRRTNRHPFSARPIPQDVTGRLREAAREEGVRLAVLHQREDIHAVAALVAEGITRQGQDHRLLQEIRAWLRPDRDPRPDGVPDEVQGEWDRRATVRTPASLLASHTRALVEASPAVFVLLTTGDAPEDWLAAGRALAHVLLLAADEGLAASYVNQPVEVADLRNQLGALVGTGFPQVVFRVGFPLKSEGTPRRPLQDVVSRAPDGPSR